VENIPDENFNESSVRDFFSQFGNIEQVDLRPYRKVAIIKYDTWDSAQKAYSSPKVIFDNRFVKCFWFKDESQIPAPRQGHGQNPNFQPLSKSREGSVAGTENGTRPPTSASPPIDLEAFRAKQEAAQAAYQEKLRKKKEMEEKMAEMQKRQEELLKRQAEEKRKLMEKLAEKEGKSVDEVEREVSGGAGEERKVSQAEALKRQLQALEEEARSLGIDPNSEDQVGSWPTRGRGRGRGRGAFVPRGGFAPRGRGGFAPRGRGGAYVPGAPNPYKLDNRTKKVGITGVDLTDGEKDEGLRQFLLVSHPIITIARCIVLTWAEHRGICRSPP
jgi:hypothetical protein